MTFEQIFAQLENCKYQCEAGGESGKLEDNKAYIELKAKVLDGKILEKFNELGDDEDFYHRQLPLFIE